jgi:hypothetical protein
MLIRYIPIHDKIQLHSCERSFKSVKYPLLDTVTIVFAAEPNPQGLIIWHETL